MTLEMEADLVYIYTLPFVLVLLLPLEHELDPEGKTIRPQSRPCGEDKGVICRELTEGRALLENKIKAENGTRRGRDNGASVLCLKNTGKT